jgi:hypothetical protein
VEFILPSSCPVEEEPKCLLALVEEDIEEQNAEDQNPENQNPNNKDPSKTNTPKKKTNSRKQVLVEDQVRRSPRLKNHRQGFKTSQCTNKKCLGCSAKPPSFSAKTIKKLGALCNIDPEFLSHEALNSRKMTAPVGKASASPEDPSDKTSDDDANQD